MESLDVCFDHMEHRYDTPVLLIHWLTIHPDKGLPMGTGGFGDTILTDCNPNTPTYDDAGCSLGGSIKLETGSPSASRIIVIPES